MANIDVISLDSEDDSEEGAVIILDTEDDVIFIGKTDAPSKGLSSNKKCSVGTDKVNQTESPIYQHRVRFSASDVGKAVINLTTASKAADTDHRKLTPCNVGLSESESCSISEQNLPNPNSSLDSGKTSSNSSTTKFQEKTMCQDLVTSRSPGSTDSKQDHAKKADSFCHLTSKKDDSDFSLTCNSDIDSNSGTLSPLSSLTSSLSSSSSSSSCGSDNDNDSSDNGVRSSLALDTSPVVIRTPLFDKLVEFHHPKADSSEDCPLLNKRCKLNSTEGTLDLYDDINIELPAECSVCQELTVSAICCPCGNMCCAFCIEKQITNLLAKGQKGFPKCPQLDCRGIHEMDKLATFLPPLVIQILQKKIEEEAIGNIMKWLVPDEEDQKQNELEYVLRLPEHWEPVTGNEDYQLIPVSPAKVEYADIRDLFHKTMFSPRAQIQSIKRVQNPSLWRFYAMKRHKMMRDLKSLCNEPVERRLFHGTKASHLDSICRDNFDWRLSGVHGTVYGIGSYFACDSSYSHRYTDQPVFLHQQQRACLLSDKPGHLPVWVCRHMMFVAKVLTGRYTLGMSTYRRPPPINEGGSDYYDSCTDSLIDPKIFVIFEKFQCYPEYVIEYTNEYY